MTNLARGALDDEPIHVGDTVMISAKVLKSVQGVGALVEIFSKTDQMQVWVAENHLRWPVIKSLPPEPADETWLLTYDEEDGMPRIFHRSDAEGHHDERRRHDEHWFDVVAQEWIDWPTATSRGAAGLDVRRMKVRKKGHAP